MTSFSWSDLGGETGQQSQLGQDFHFVFLHGLNLGLGHPEIGGLDFQKGRPSQFIGRRRPADFRCCSTDSRLISSSFRDPRQLVFGFTPIADEVFFRLSSTVVGGARQRFLRLDFLGNTPAFKQGPSRHRPHLVLVDFLLDRSVRVIPAGPGRQLKCGPMSRPGGAGGRAGGVRLERQRHNFWTGHVKRTIRGRGESCAQTVRREPELTTEGEPLWVDARPGLREGAG